MVAWSGLSGVIFGHVPSLRCEASGRSKLNGTSLRAAVIRVSLSKRQKAGLRAELPKPQFCCQTDRFGQSCGFQIQRTQRPAGSINRAVVTRVRVGLVATNHWYRVLQQSTCRQSLGWYDAATGQTAQLQNLIERAERR